MGVYAKDELPPFDWQPMKEPEVEKVESLLEVVDSKPSPGDTKTHKAEFFQEFKLDEEDDSEEEETIDDYEGLVSEDGEMSPGDDGDHELIEAETKEKPRDLSVEEEISAPPAAPTPDVPGCRGCGQGPHPM